MSEPKGAPPLELEHVALFCDEYGIASHAAKVRAADRVVAAAKKFVKGEPDRLSYEDDLRALGNALRDFDRAGGG